MSDLRTLGGPHVIVGGEEFPRFRRFAHGVVEAVQPLRQFALDDRLEFADLRPARFVETEKGQSAFDILIGAGFLVAILVHSASPVRPSLSRNGCR